MADNFLERQYAAYEERKKNLVKGAKAKKPSVKFYTRPGTPKSDSDAKQETKTSGKAGH